MRPSTRALGLDALYQVLDNGVFRILAVLAALPVLLFVLVRVTPDELSILFGWKSWPLADVARTFGAQGAADPQAAVIGSFLDVVFFDLVGRFGTLFCIAATAFFVPRMLEKGSVDVLFHKPVSSTRFFLSRYAAGLLFVFLLSLFSATGVYLVLIVFSGFYDPGVFAIVVGLTWVFALVFPVSVLAGVLTRSTVASLLFAGLFFGANGCVHITWIQHETKVLDTLADMTSPEPGPVSVRVGTSEEPEAGSATTAGPDLVRWFWLALDVAHFALPKTSDTPYIVAKLRRAAARPLWFEPENLLQIDSLPSDLSRLPLAALAGPDDPFARARALASDALGEPRFAARGADGATAVLFLRPGRTIERQRSNGTTRKRPELTRDASDLLRESLAGAGGFADVHDVAFDRRASRAAATPAAGEEDGAPDAGAPPDAAPVLPISFFADLLAWSEPDTPTPDVRALVFTSGTEVATLLVRSSSPDPVGPPLTELAPHLGYSTRESAYGKLLRWNAGWRTNLATSIGTSLLFVVLVLAFGAWRLSRADF